QTPRVPAPASPKWANFKQNALAPIERQTSDRDSLERLRVLVSAPLTHIAVALAHELLEVPLAARFRDLALVLPQGFDLLLEGRRDVDQVITRGPGTHRQLIDFVPSEDLLQQ